MTPLRSRLIEEITLRNYSPRTAEAYVHAVYCLAQHYRRSLDTLSDEELRQYLLHLHLNTDKAASTLNVAVSGLRFFYQRVLHRQFYHLERNLPRPRQPKRRPKAYSLREVRKLIDKCTHPKHRAFLLTVYGAGLRLNEACHLRPEHIERDQRLIRVEQGKGRKDRYTVLPDRVLRELESYLTGPGIPSGMGMCIENGFPLTVRSPVGTAWDRLRVCRHLPWLQTCHRGILQPWQTPIAKSIFKSSSQCKDVKA